MQNYARWTEDRLSQEIDRLGSRIAEISKLSDRRSRHAVSYMRQLLKEKKDKLALLKLGAST